MQSRECLKRIWNKVKIWMVKYPEIECLSIIRSKYKKSRPNDVVMSVRNISIDFQANFSQKRSPRFYAITILSLLTSDLL